MSVVVPRSGLRFRPPPEVGKSSNRESGACPPQESLEPARAGFAPSQGGLILAGLSLLASATNASAQVEEVLHDSSELLDPQLSPQNRDLLRESLDRLPSSLRAELIRQGLRVAVVDPGESLLDKGVIEAVEPANLKAHSDGARLGNEISETGLSDFDRQVMELTEGRWRAFRPVGRGRGSYSTREIATHHGVDDPWFLEQIEVANAPGLKGARQEVLLREQARVEEGGLFADAARERLEQYRTDPLSIPIDWRATPLAVPDWHHFERDGLGLELSGHDRSTLEQWDVEEGRVVPHRTLEGQYFGQGQNHVVVLSPLGVSQPETVLHEIGHAVLRAYERRSPEEFSRFEQKLRAAHDGVIPHGIGAEVDPDRGAITDGSGRYQISNYSRVSPEEYFAEGFAHYLTEPESLNRLDPLLTKLVEQTLPPVHSLSVAEGKDRSKSSSVR